jgi:hypothetical protein
MLDYLGFLCNLVDNSKEYSILLSSLHDIKFYSLVPNDDNRIEDGKQWRQKFEEEVGYNPAFSLSHLDEDCCSVLEMLIGLSYRLEFETIDSSWEKTPSEWIFILLDNLSLSPYDDIFMRPNRSIDNLIYDKIEVLVYRRYEKNGYGGLFPLKNPRKDQRKVEIWYQMSAYMLENYPI